MSIRRALSKAADGTALVGGRMLGAARLKKVALMPVLHVERLHEEKNHVATIEFCAQYKALTGKRLVATIIPPVSEFLKNDLRRAGVSIEAYEEKLKALAEVSIIGHHGHYLRQVVGGFASSPGVAPMHSAFFDDSHIQYQLAMESEWLTSHDLMDRREMIYSAGWWFMNPSIQGALHRLGYRYDFSLALTRDAYSHSAWLAQRSLPGERGPLRLSEDGELLGAYAISSVSVPGRPLACARRVLAELFRRGLCERDKNIYFTFYAHDYDLVVRDAVKNIEYLVKMGFEFFEPIDLRAA